MKAIRRPRLSLLLFSLLLAVTGCAAQTDKRAAADAVRLQDLGGLPYHPLVYHLDLSILAYQLYSQTLVWPFDPYYEELNNRKWDRTTFMNKVREWAKKQGAEQSGRSAGLNAYRGPGVLGGFNDNPQLDPNDPILYQYGLLRPWGKPKTITNPEGKWIEYMTPEKITQSIQDVYMCYRPTGLPKEAVILEPVLPKRDDSAPNASDVLLAFEGETGNKGELGQSGSQSLMGFVLLRTKAGDKYDVHIAFRGSRSGSGARAVWQANWEHHASGNPDWITDMGYDLLTAANDKDTVGDIITRTGAVHRGFAHSMKSILPKVFRCLNEAADIKRGIRPDNIYVTGHSLGGALAQHFVSAVLLGNHYGPGGAGEQMPAALRGWPWKQIKLITYSAPRAGNEEWASKLTVSGLDSEFFSTVFYPIDTKALAPTDPGIVSRLLDIQRPAGYRVLSSKDPITTEKVAGGKHVGKTVYVNESSFWDVILPPDTEAHEPRNIRDLMLKSLDDMRIPPAALGYLEMKVVNPKRNEKKRGDLEEYEKLRTALEMYYRSKDLSFDQNAFSENFDEFKTILQAPGDSR